MENNKAIFIFLGIILLGSGLAMATGRATTVTAGDMARWTPTGAGADVTEGGNITNANLSGSSLTDKWAGYYGVVSGSLLLRASGDTSDLYNWTWNDAAGGVVCASEATAFPFSSAANTTASAVDTAYGFTTATDVDQAVDTFTTALCTVAFSEGSVAGTINTTHKGSSTFGTCVVSDGTTVGEDNFAFCVAIQDDASGLSYKNSAASYELMVATTMQASESYYFYVDLQ